MKKLKALVDGLINWSVTNVVVRRELHNMISRNGKVSNPPGLKEWYDKWRGLGKPNKDYYRVFSQYSGYNTDIVPDNICHNIISPILNPKRLISVYGDKNMFDKFLDRPATHRFTPITLLRSIGGCILDGEYNEIGEVDLEYYLIKESQIIVKPSMDSSSGEGISFFHRTKKGWINHSGELLSWDFLQKYAGNFILQRTLKQSPFMASLCKTSINTIRVGVYRSVKDNKGHVMQSIIRFGKDGSLVDNAHAGGVFIGVDDKGRLGKCCYDQYGTKIEKFNGVDFSTSELRIPNYDKVKELAEEVGNRLPHLRLLALDIMLDEKNTPILIEYNVKAFAPWLFQFASGPAFGKYTDEIMNYCKEHQEEATRIFVSF